MTTNISVSPPHSAPSPCRSTARGARSGDASHPAGGRLRQHIITEHHEHTKSAQPREAQTR